MNTNYTFVTGCYITRCFVRFILIPFNRKLPFYPADTCPPIRRYAFFGLFYIFFFFLFF